MLELELEITEICHTLLVFREFNSPADVLVGICDQEASCLLHPVVRQNGLFGQQVQVVTFAAPFLQSTVSYLRLLDALFLDRRHRQGCQPSQHCYGEDLHRSFSRLKAKTTPGIIVNPGPHQNNQTN
jgi:hypothetical protein